MGDVGTERVLSHGFNTSADTDFITSPNSGRRKHKYADIVSLTDFYLYLLTR